MTTTAPEPTEVELGTTGAPGRRHAWAAPVVAAVIGAMAAAATAWWIASTVELSMGVGAGI
jgi:hypothetical protein